MRRATRRRIVERYRAACRHGGAVVYLEGRDGEEVIVRYGVTYHRRLTVCFHDPATSDIYTPSLPDPLPSCCIIS